MRIGLALRMFFKILLDGQWATEVQGLLDDRTGDRPEAKAAGTRSPQSDLPSTPVRSDAIALLETLQREARFVDIVHEPLGDYNDAQIGAAARDVLGRSVEALKVEPVG